MSSFWQTQLGGAPAAAPVAPQQAPAGPWWATPTYPTSAPVQQPQVPQQAPQWTATPPEEEGWGTVAGSTQKAQSARVDTNCPECGSDHFFRPAGMGMNTMTQCYDCGYNPRFSQTGGQGGMASGTDGGAARPARQTVEGGRGGVSHFSPGTIIGKV